MSGTLHPGGGARQWLPPSRWSAIDGRERIASLRVERNRSDDPIARSIELRRQAAALLFRSIMSGSGRERAR
jgi:hypothetical protein